MAVLSARFAVLACLCAVIPLAPSVEAAHLYGGQSMGKHTSFTHSPHRTRTTYLGGPTAAHGYDDTNHRHQEHRVSGLPPLLRRYHVHNHEKGHQHHGQDSHDHGHHKVPRSAFTRSRYRREPVSYGGRSSVYVPGEHGKTYLVTRAPPRSSEHGHADADKQSAQAYNKRQVDENNLAFGTIQIMVNSPSSDSTQRLASLTVDSTPIDWTSSPTSAKAFPLNASTTNQTQFIMMPMDDYNAGASTNKHVVLATEVFDAGSAEMVMYCATYDADPETESALLMTPCTGSSRAASSTNATADPCTDDEIDASSSNPHQSQIFSYDPSSGKVEPISATDSSSGSGGNTSTSLSCAGAKFRRDSSNSTSSGSVKPSSTTTSRAPAASALQQAQNVTLVYVAGALEVPAASPSSLFLPTISTTATPSANFHQAAVYTTTVTTTVVATVTASAPLSAQSVAPARAAVTVSTALTPSLSTTTPTSTVSTTSTRPSLSLSSTTSTGVTLTTPQPPKADASLEVEVVGSIPSDSASSSATSTSTTSSATTTSSSSSASVSPTLDAAAIASMVANQMAHR